MRRLRLAAPAQLSLDVGASNESARPTFFDLPEETQLRVLAVLGRLIARGVIVGESGEEDSGD